MSKRFGRNQKRKFLEQVRQLKSDFGALNNQLCKDQKRIVELIDANRLNQKLNEELVSKLKYFEYVFKNVEEVLGEYFIGLPPKEKENIFEELPYCWRECLPPKMRALDISAEPQATIILKTVQTLSRYKFESFVDHLRQQRHFFLTKKGDHFLAYYIDENHLNKLPFDELVQIIAKSFAHHIKTGK